MRIATLTRFDVGIATLQRRQRELTELQEQMTSGKRVARPSDDPIAAATAERALAREQRVSADQRALEVSRNAMSQVESALGAAGEMLIKARELVVGAGNGMYSDAERKTLGAALRNLRLDLLAVSNRGDGSGGYLFGGQAAVRPPFLDTPTGVTFDGTPGEPRNAAGEALPLAADGRAIWLQVPNAITGAPDLSLFTVLDRIATELETPGRTPAEIALGVADGLRDLDALAAHFSAHRARAGGTLNRTDSVELRLSEQALHAATERSGAEDLDMVQAISEFQSKQSGYDAALKTYSMVQRLSLFQYIDG